MPPEIRMFQRELSAAEAACYGLELIGAFVGKYLRGGAAGGTAETGDGKLTAAMLPTQSGDGDTDEPVGNVRAKGGNGETIYSATPNVSQDPVQPPFVTVWYYRQVGAA